MDKMGQLKLIDINVDCLLRVFDFLSEKDLMSLCQAHWIFRTAINDNIFYTKTLDLLMCGHRNNPRIQERTQILSYENRLRIGRNWVAGNYREHEYFHHGQMFATKLHLERDWLYITHAGYLRKHRRLDRHEPLQRRYQQEICTGTKSDIADFTKKRETVFAGRICGNCFIYEDGYATEQQLHSAKEYLYCVDFAGDLYVTSTNHCGKLWRRSEEFGLIHLDQLARLKHSYKAMILNDSGDRLYGGLYTDVGRRALREVDVESGFESILNSDTISIYDLKLKDDNVIFTANFDTTFRMHDRRSNSDEHIWEDPFDSSFYCLEYDGLYAVLCGAKYHSRVNLYDIRVPGKYMQLYFPHRSRRQHHSSPVYSIACDSRYLFVATDHNLRVFDYKADSIRRDFRNLFSETRRI